MRWKILGGLAAVAILAYLPTLHQPLLEDDYHQISLANRLGPISGWSELAHDPAFRLRATMQPYLAALYANFDMNAAAYYASASRLHVLNTWLVYALGTWKRIGYSDQRLGRAGFRRQRRASGSRHVDRSFE